MAAVYARENGSRLKGNRGNAPHASDNTCSRELAYACDTAAARARETVTAAAMVFKLEWAYVTTHKLCDGKLQSSAARRRALARAN